MLGPLMRTHRQVPTWAALKSWAAPGPEPEPQTRRPCSVTAGCGGIASPNKPEAGPGVDRTASGTCLDPYAGRTAFGTK
jgi:hypothetical protein